MMTNEPGPADVAVLRDDGLDVAATGPDGTVRPGDLKPRLGTDQPRGQR